MLTNDMLWVYYHMQRWITRELSAAKTFVGVLSITVEYATVWSAFRTIVSDIQIKYVYMNINVFESYIG